MIFQDPLTALAPDDEHRSSAHRARAPSSRPVEAAALERATRAARTTCGSPTLRVHSTRSLISSPAACASASRSRSVGVRTEAHRRRRADDSPRRNGSGRDTAPVGHPAAREGSVGDPHHARPRSDVGDRRLHFGDVRGTRRRRGSAADVLRPTTPVHESPLARATASGFVESDSPPRDPRCTADRGRCAGRLRVSSRVQFAVATCATDAPPLVRWGNRTFACPVDPFGEAP